MNTCAYDLMTLMIEQSVLVSATTAQEINVLEVKLKEKKGEEYAYLYSHLVLYTLELSKFV